MDYTPYARQCINAEDLESVQQALQGTTITRGHYVEAFEKKIAELCQVGFAVAFNSGTSALQAAYFAAELNSSHRILTSPNTFIGTFVGALQRGATVKFIDIDCSTGNMDLAEFSASSSDVIVPVHFSGIPVDVEKLHKKAPSNLIIEDAAHALGAYYQKGMPVGSCCYSDMTVFSFHPAKTITTGEGGMVTTSNSHFYERLKLFRNNGIIPETDGEFPGYYRSHHLTGNTHLTDFQAALGLSQLKRFDYFLEKRRNLVKIYRQLLENRQEIQFFDPVYDSLSAHHLCVVQIDFQKLNKTKRELMQCLKEKGIATQVHYIPAYHHPIDSLSKQSLPHMEKYYAQALTLPLFVDLSPEKVEEICAILITQLDF